MTQGEGSRPGEARRSTSDSGPLSVPGELVRFAELVKEGRFWDSHEVLEGPWRETGSDFYHGLILFASAFVHVKRNNLHGIGAQLRKALPYLDARRPAYLGVNVEAQVAHTRDCLTLLREREEDPPDRWEELIPFPTIDLDPERIRGDEEELRRSRA